MGIAFILISILLDIIGVFFYVVVPFVVRVLWKLKILPPIIFFLIFIFTSDSNNNIVSTIQQVSLLLCFLTLVYAPFGIIKSIIEYFTGDDFSWIEFIRNVFSFIVSIPLRIYKHKNNIEKIYPDYKLDNNYVAILNFASSIDYKDVIDFLSDWNGYTNMLYVISKKIKEVPLKNPISFSLFMKEVYFAHFPKYYVNYLINSSHFDYENFKEKEKVEEKIDSNHASGSSFDFFKGVDSINELKKRYRNLLKIYHPDNYAGDTSITQMIQEQYEKILNK